MTHCWICGASDVQVPNCKIKYTGKYCGKRRQKTVRICDCCSGWLSDKDIEERVREAYSWDDPDEEEKQMTITEMIRNKRYTSSVSKIKKYSCVNIGFMNQEHEEDETQLNVSHSLLTDDGIRELSELFASLSKELDTSPDNVIYVHVAASADTEEELINLGY